MSSLHLLLPKIKGSVTVLESVPPWIRGLVSESLQTVFILYLFTGVPPQIIRGL